MRRRNLAIAAAGAALAVVLAWFLWPSGSKDPDGKGKGQSSAARQRAARRSGTADRRPAGIAGRVVNDKGRPIAGAVVSIAMRNLSRGERSQAGAAPEPLTATTGRRWPLSRRPADARALHGVGRGARPHPGHDRSARAGARRAEGGGRTSRSAPAATP